MALNNRWVGYVHRTYQQIKDQVLTNLANLVPEITDHTESNPYVKFLSIWAGLTEHLNYYIDNAARELFLSTTRQYASAIKISKLFDYRIRGVKAATADVTFTLSSALGANYIIQIGTVVSTDDAIQFVTVSAGVIPAGSLTVVVPVKQQVLIPEVTLGTSDGSINQKYLLTSDTEDTSLTVKVGSIVYIFKPTLAFSNSLDKVFTSSLNIDRVLEISFGDGVQGAIPPAGQDILVQYATSSGEAGNLAENTIINIVSTLVTTPNGETVSVTNLGRASGGADVQSLKDLQKAIPLSNRTLGRAVTFQDYTDIAELQAGVATAGTVFKCGKTVDVYIVPTGGGTAPQTLLDEVKDAYYDETRMVTTKVRVLSAGEIKVTLGIDVEVLPAFNRLVVETDLRARLSKYINLDSLIISGGLRIGNIYEIVENTVGVNYSKINSISLVPYARIIGGLTNLNWTRIMSATSNSTIRWTLKVASTGELELVKDGTYAGTYLVGQLVSLAEIQFTVNAGVYVTGDSWEFYTYPNNESIILQEPSVCVLYDANLTLNMTGGV